MASTGATSASALNSQKKKGGCCGGGGGGSSAAASSNDGVRMSQASRGGPGGARERRQRSKGPIEAKIILLGDSAVGKSSIALRFCQDRFDEVHDVTIGGAYL